MRIFNISIAIEMVDLAEPHGWEHHISWKNHKDGIMRIFNISIAIEMVDLEEFPWVGAPYFWKKYGL